MANQHQQQAASQYFQYMGFTGGAEPLIAEIDEQVREVY